MYSQYLLLAVIMTFIIGRLIGTKISFMKQVMASLFSVIVTSSVYWYAYLRFQSADTFGADGWLWLLSMVIVSLLFYLFFEMFDPISIGEKGDRLSDTRNPIRAIFAWWRRQRRYVQVLFIALKHGVGKNLTLKRTPASDQKLAVSLRKSLRNAADFSLNLARCCRRALIYCRLR